MIRISPDRLVLGGLPEALAETLLNVPKPEGAAVWALFAAAAPASRLSPTATLS